MGVGIVVGVVEGVGEMTVVGMGVDVGEGKGVGVLVGILVGVRLGEGGAIGFGLVEQAVIIDNKVQNASVHLNRFDLFIISSLQ